MRTAAALDDVLASRSHIRILRALDAIPEGLGMSVRDLARRAGVTHPRASEVLSSLAQLGVTSRQRAGRADLYQLNRAHLLYGMSSSGKRRRSTPSSGATFVHAYPWS